MGGVKKGGGRGGEGGVLGVFSRVGGVREGFRGGPGRRSPGLDSRSYTGISDYLR